MLLSVGQVVAAASLCCLAGTLFGWLLARHQWKSAFHKMRALFEATIASAEEAIAEQDRRLEILERTGPDRPAAAARPVESQSKLRDADVEVGDS